jgi:hypothetical protein
MLPFGEREGCTSLYKNVTFITRRSRVPRLISVQHCSPNADLWPAICTVASARSGLIPRFATRDPAYTREKFLSITVQKRNFRDNAGLACRVRCVRRDCRPMILSCPQERRRGNLAR